jgi:D-tyrosyl-tRNA(Tyr) deacylase
MRIVIQRVDSASVTIDGDVRSKIDKGVLILLGIEDNDTEVDIEWLCKKISNLRIFNDVEGVMNKSVIDIGGEILVVSQFTLYASTKKGNRPSYIRASKPDIAVPIYEKFIEALGKMSGIKIKTGIFGAMMDVAMVNSGPVTIIMDSKDRDF